MGDLHQCAKTAEGLSQNNKTHKTKHFSPLENYFQNVFSNVPIKILTRLYNELDPTTRFYPLSLKHKKLLCLLNHHDPAFPMKIFHNRILIVITDYGWHWLHTFLRYGSSTTYLRRLHANNFEEMKLLSTKGGDRKYTAPYLLGLLTSIKGKVNHENYITKLNTLTNVN